MAEMTKMLPITEHFQNLDDPMTYYKSESGFLEFIVLPLYQAVYDFCEGDIEDVFTLLKDNHRHYSDSLEELKRKKEQEDHKIKFGSS